MKDNGLIIIYVALAFFFIPKDMLACPLSPHSNGYNLICMD